VADFATVALQERGRAIADARGYLGFATEDELKQSGFPPELVTRFFTMQVGDVMSPFASTAVSVTSSTEEKAFANGESYAGQPRSSSANYQALIKKRKDILDAALSSGNE